MLLLDTHVWLWCVSGETRRMGHRALRLIERAHTTDAVRVSSVSAYEVTTLHTHGRLRLSLPPEQWIAEALAVPGIRLAEFTTPIAADAGMISRTHLADPLDRFLVATARHLGATMLTLDELILRYAADTHALRVHDASR